MGHSSSNRQTRVREQVGAHQLFVMEGKRNVVQVAAVPQSWSVFAEVTYSQDTPRIQGRFRVLQDQASRRQPYGLEQKQPVLDPLADPESCIRNSQVDGHPGSRVG